MTTLGQPLSIETTPIDGLLVVRLQLHGDARGWFKEHWQREKMVSLGLPDFGPVQQNVSFNAPVGVTRGLHAEPWDKYVSVANGRAFGAWVDLREGDGFGTTFTLELAPDVAVFVPRGVANGFQTLEENVNYMYLVGDHWSPEARYALVNLADPMADVPWPIPLAEAVVSDKDLGHPMLDAVAPVAARETLVIGADGQLGRALREQLGKAGVRYVDRDEFDMTDPAVVAGYDWRTIATVINAAAFTAVDAAETPEGRRAAWAVNATAQRDLALACLRHDLTFVSVSTNYVFDGTAADHTEDEQLAPMSVYGASKAAGELIVSMVPRHYLVRTSWVVGDGANFVATMARLAKNGVDPTVVDDQHGRLTFADDLAAAILHLLKVGAQFGTYNFSNSGPTGTWFDVARATFELVGEDAQRVSPVTTEQYLSGQPADRLVAPRPVNSTFDLAKIEGTGLVIPDWQDRLRSRLIAD